MESEGRYCNKVKEGKKEGRKETHEREAKIQRRGEGEKIHRVERKGKRLMEKGGKGGDRDRHKQVRADICCSQCR